MKTISISIGEAEQLFEAIPENISDRLDDLAIAIEYAIVEARDKRAPISITLTIEASEEDEDDE